MVEEITFSKEVRDKLLSGINKASKAVSATLGPNGKTVIISDSSKFGQYKVTKDGVSVINSIKLKDPIENIGVQLLREAAKKTVEEKNNCLTNLEWCTHGENIQHSYKLENRSALGENNAKCKTNEKIFARRNEENKRC